MEEKNIKTISDFKEEIHRCSKCGICQSACPLYKVTGNECTVSRGQFIMLNGIIKGDLKLNKNINRYLDMCLKCNKCTQYCPSEINALDIILTAKHEYFKNSLEGKIYGFLESKYVFGFFLKSIEKLCTIFTPKYKSKTYSKKAVYFGGCINKLHPEVNNYAKKLLNEMEIEVIDKSFDCCGMPFLTTGNIERFIEVAIKNTSLLPGNIEYIITDCASCNWAWREYTKYIDNENLKQKLENIKIISIYDLISQSAVKFRAKKTLSVTYHKPCHEKGEEAFNILKSIENIEYTEMDGYDECCGFGGFEHPYVIKDLKPIYKKKSDNVKKASADVVLTSCVGCLMSISTITGFRKKTRRLITFLKDYCNID